jgi:hypothetical protein
MELFQLAGNDFSAMTPAEGGNSQPSAIRTNESRALTSAAHFFNRAQRSSARTSLFLHILCARCAVRSGVYFAHNAAAREPLSFFTSCARAALCAPESISRTTQRG